MARCKRRGSSPRPPPTHELVDHDLERLFVAGIFAASIGLLHLPHRIAGDVAVLFGLVLSPTITRSDYAAFLALSTLGNAVGSRVFVGLLKYSRVVRGAG